MNVQERIGLLVDLGSYMQGNAPEWLQAKEKASIENGWFTPEFIDLSINNIVGSFLEKEALSRFAAQYPLQDTSSEILIGLVMAGNIPLVGFHDFLCIFLSGHKQLIKASSKDNVLINHLIEYLHTKEERTRELVSFAELLKGCDAYIATGSNNSARYFDYYFSKYPSIIRRNRTSVAVLTGNETMEDLSLLADDVFLYFGLGCRNVTSIFVPEEYDFVPMLEAFKKYHYLSEHNKYKNNYDYQLALHLLNNKYYMTNGALLLVENDQLFSPISELHYVFYNDYDSLLKVLKEDSDIQCIAGQNGIGFGQAQQPRLTDFADGVDTMKFLTSLH